MRGVASKMVLSTLSTFPFPTSSVIKLETLPLKNGGVTRIGGVTASLVPRNRKLTGCSVSDVSASTETNVPFPTDYTELLEQARVAVELAMKDNRQLMEIEFPTAGLASVPGDGEGGIEMTESMQLIREFCDRFISSEKTTRTRIFFPEASEVDFARQSVFSGASFKLDYLTKPSFFQDFGFVEKVKMSDRVKAGDELFLVAYPYFNVNEMLVVEELYKEAVLNTERKLIIFNGELDRIRSGYYPPFFYPKLAALNKTFLPMMETVYYIHNFKGRNGGTLFRCYPGPWKVLRRVGNKYICLHQQVTMPSLKEVALEILPAN
ncbi:PREDICTED: protein LOW PSII ACCUMULATION 3, chloroplastic isoform X1 [Lupinus angustifolius]|uniref:protein LOW PSII ACCUMULATION 3, chloroplastic isoform X1 n=1 Tax=Lupinus angustifolius TaxID=3871 RepID=UPI00092E951A|nr:PREDICTED: protein LOW PSII ACCUMULATION 3, chloroplastic isoform X1 [Lupinus angustifolius]XP_019445239.1 PREDICTED: protein LOW PSII ACCUMULATION 3, chloroplastic isoform X1 [Lupinus angustifolius]XP_019445241.1 PREDICTED: protein LOW PSII ACCUMULATION 3, chloroplastic isoform X1 [Lupinus angustifolius]